MFQDSPLKMNLNSESLLDIIIDVVNISGEKIKFQGIDLRFDREEEGFNTAVPMMRTMIYQVFMNLITNACFELQNKENPWLEVKSFVKSDHLLITIADSGDGIPKEVRAKIFEPFFTTKDIGKGTGLGLSTSFKIMQSHGGELYLDEDSKETKFCIKMMREIPAKLMQKKSA